MRIEGCHAVITGASAGLGWEFARQLGPHAKSLVLIARRRQRLEQLRDDLARKHPALRVEVHSADLSNRAAVDELLDWIGRENLAIDLLINNAGLGDLGSFATADPERTDQMMRVNMVALTELTRGLLPGMIARKHGAILNVSSSASFLPIPNFAVYSATKAYVTSFSEGIRGELHGSGVTVTALCPGPVRTEFTDVARRKPQARTAWEPKIAYVAVEEVVAAGLRGVERDRAIVIPGAIMKIGMALVRLTPPPLLRLANRFTAKSA
jgi:short-subunit dehydrogenase